MAEINRLYAKLKSITPEELYKVESDFCNYFYSNLDKMDSYISAFLVVVNWRAASERSGVWTFYEATKQSEIEQAVEYLQHNEKVLASMIEKGIHDYQNPVYAESFNYPDEWIEESEEIDNWIENNEAHINKWIYDSLISNEGMLCARFAVK